MRVVLIGPVYPYRGGIAHYTTMLWRALAEAGHTTLLVSFRRQYPRWLFPGESDRDPSRQPLVVEGAQYWIDSLNPLTWVLTAWRICRYRPAAVVLPWWTTFWAPAWSVLGCLLRLGSSRPLLIICHNVLPHEARWRDRLMARAVLRWGTHFMVQSEAEHARLQALIPGAAATVIPHPVYDMFADGRLPREEARRRLSLPQGSPVLLFFGIVREYKGLADLLDALPCIRSQVAGTVLLIAGEFWDDKQPYTTRIAQLGLQDAVKIDDRYIPNEEVALYFSAADVLVAPYRRVTGSGAVQMGHGFGLPVVAGPIAAPEGEQRNRLLADQIVTALITGVSDPQLEAGPIGTWDQVTRLVGELTQAV